MADDLQAALFAGDATPFIATSAWAPILPGQSVPAGLWMRMDIATGGRMARLMPTDEERMSGTEQGPTSPPALEDQRGVRDDDFDETTPGDDEGVTPETFFDVYTPVFARNAVFSAKSRVPTLGNMSSANFEVDAFYDFWSNFTSNRVFPDEELDASVTAASRAQKQRDNEKKQQNARRRDTTRVRQLAAAAAAKDPRVARVKREAEEASRARSARKQAEAAAKEGRSTQ